MEDLHLIVSKAYLSALAGELDAASAGIEWVRSQCAIQSNAAMAVEVMVVEGVVHIYSGRTRAGVERLSRAVAIGDSAKLQNLAALARGWLAVVHYNEGDVVAAGGAVSEALRFPEFAEARTRLRVSTVAGGLCEYSGLSKSAAGWLTAAQSAARGMGVPGVLSTVVYDMALAAVDSAAARRLEGSLQSSDAKSLPLRVKSALHYDETANVGVHRELHWLILGMAHNICEEYVEASSCLEKFLSGPRSFRAADQICAYIELAVASSKGGALDVDSDLIEKITDGLGLLIEPVERAMAFEILSSSYRRQGLIYESALMKEKYALEIGKRTDLSSSLENLIREGPVFCPPMSWIN